MATIIIRAMEITKQQARRFLLAKQGLWPAPHNLPPAADYDARAATMQAIAALGIVQVDTISVVARNHDLVLHSRVPGYKPEYLDGWLYGPERQAFESLYPLYVQPLSDYRLLRQPQREPSKRGKAWAMENAELLAFTLAEIVRRGPLSSRDFAGRPIVAGGFNKVKDVTNALWHLWYYDRIYTAYRRGAVRYYDLAERVLPAWVDCQPLAAEEVKRQWAVRTLKILNLANTAQWSYRLRCFYGSHDLAAGEGKRLLQELLDFTTFSKVKIAGVADDYFVLTKDLPLLEQLAGLADDATPAPLGVSFIAPLDSLMWERKRIAELFDFDYVWEVYVAAAKRKWGYYVLPILYGTQLVGRLDAKVERKLKRLLVHNLWLEPQHAQLASDATFRDALHQTLERFMHFNGATYLQVGHCEPATLRTMFAD